MSIDTLQFVKEAEHSGFTVKQAEFLVKEASFVNKEKVGNEYLNERLTGMEEKFDQKLKHLSNEITIRFGGLMIVGMSILGFILKH